MRFKRVLATLGATAVAISSLLVTAQHAAASTGTISTLSWAYNDVRQPLKSFVDQPGDAPVGARIAPDNTYHRSKSYFTFDVAKLQGGTIQRVNLGFGERSANDCTKPRSTELWAVEHSDKPPTWLHQPKELAKQPGPFPEQGSECVTPYQLTFNVTDYVAKQVAAGAKKVTFVLRMPEQVQAQPSYGRTYNSKPNMYWNANWPPYIPANASVGLAKCADGPSVHGGHDVWIAADVRDPDYEWLKARFVVWPADKPAERREIVADVGYGGGRPDVPLIRDSYLVDGTTYKWTVRAEDAMHVSEWMPECTFSVDFTAPDKEPEVSSSDYPENSGPPGTGGAGIPGRFTLGPSGVQDVIGYYINDTFVSADRPGGGATAEHAPQSTGPNHVQVHSVDKAGNRSPSRTYLFWVANTGPDISCPEQVGLLPFQCVLKAVRVPDAASFTYRVGNGPETTVPAVNGAATVDVTATMDDRVFEAWSTSSAGVRSGFTRVSLDVRDSPLVHSDDYPGLIGSGGPGVPGDFVFKPGMPGVATYHYRLDPEGRGERGSVPAGPDGTATVTLTPQRSGFITLLVWSVTADGKRSEQTTSYLFYVND